MSNTQLQTKVNDLRGILEKAKSRLAEVAPKHMKVERLLRLMLTACSRTPKILDCTQESILAFCMKCSETGLEPIGAGGAWAIPYGAILTFIPDYRGLVNCAKRSDCIKDAYAEVVYEKDEFNYELGMEPILEHVPARGDRGVLEAAYCIIVFPDNTKRFIVMDRHDVEGIKKRSKAASSGPWKTDEAEMWKKTVVRRAMKPFIGMSSQLDAAIEADDKAGQVIDVTPIAQPRSTDDPPTAEEEVCGTRQSTIEEPDNTPKKYIIEGVDTIKAVKGVAPKHRWKAIFSRNDGQEKLTAFFNDPALKDAVDDRSASGFTCKPITAVEGDCEVLVKIEE